MRTRIQQLWWLAALVWALAWHTSAWCAELRLPGVVKRVYDGDTFVVELPACQITLPQDSRIDGRPAQRVEVPALLIKVRLVDNSKPGITRPLGAPELHGANGKAERGALKARDRLQELAVGRGGYLVVNLNLACGKTDRDPSLARLLTLDRLLADFQVEGDRQTVGQRLFAEGLVREWRKHR
jgi:endonuclease YncB( thermonuclease family)